MTMFPGRKSLTLGITGRAFNAEFTQLLDEKLADSRSCACRAIGRVDIIAFLS